MTNVIGIWLFIGILITLIYVLKLDGWNPDFRWCFPSHLYKNTHMNKFGCWFVFCIFFVSSFIPIMICICDFIYWLFHVGRRG